MKDEEKALRATRAHTAVLRSLTDEMQRSQSGVESDLQEQAVEESARLVSAARELAQARSEFPAASSACESVEEVRPRVLLVEDDDASRSALANGLAPFYDVYCATTGVEGLKAASQRDFDAVVTDLWMPEMDGISMVAQIRGMQPLAAIPVILLTAETSPEPIMQGFAAGGTTYLAKPVDLDLLHRELQWALRASSDAGRPDLSNA